MEPPLTAAELLRRKKKKNVVEVKVEKEQVDLDDEIARLEAELQNDDDSSDDDESSSSIEEEEEAVICQSAVARDRIEPLPPTVLPSNKRKRLKIDEDAESPRKKSNTGLEAAVKEVLSGYVARSSERLPFYCRVCAKQYDNEKEFFDHKETDFHKVAAEMERKASYCKLCKKQLTSPVQLKEHLTSKPHKETLEKMKGGRQRLLGGRGRIDNRGRQWT